MAAEKTRWDQDKDLVDELCAIEHGLSDWEMDFVDSIDNWVVKQKKTLTTNQRNTAEKILHRIESE